VSSPPDIHSCARRTTGRLYCWGYGHFGQLGGGTPIEEVHAPVEVVGHATDWTSVTVGTAHTCARKSDGHLYCWGRDGAGQLGNGDTVTADQASPVEVAAVIVIET
jgi:alpha-tubulin suppressor-like RCC1 family protein